MLKQSDGEKQSALYALAKISLRERNIVPLLIEAIKSEDVYSMIYAIEAAGNIGQNAYEAIHILTKIIYDNYIDIEIRIVASKALNNIKNIDKK